MSMYGANPEQLAALGRSLKQQIQEIDRVMHTVGSALSGTTWVGPARDRFENDWNSTFRTALQRLNNAFDAVQELPVGGTAVGTGINAHPEFGPRVAQALREATGYKFKSADNYFEGIGSQRGIACRSGDSLSLREFLGVSVTDSSLQRDAGPRSPAAGSPCRRVPVHPLVGAEKNCLGARP